MAESRSHRSVKRQFAGKRGKTEVRLPSGKRLDALSQTRIAAEVERGGTTGIRKAVKRLKEAVDTGIARKATIAVPDWNMGKATKEMRRQRVRGGVENLGGTRYEYVPKRTSARW